LLQLKPKGDGGGNGILTGMWTHVWAIKRRHSLRLLLPFELPVGSWPWGSLAALSCHFAILRGLRCAHWRVDPFMAIVWPFSTIFLAFSFLFFLLLPFLHPATFNTPRVEGGRGMMESGWIGLCGFVKIYQVFSLLQLRK